MYLNDLQVSVVHIERLIKDIVSSGLIFNNFMASEVQMVEHEVHALQDFSPKIKAILKVCSLVFFCFTYEFSHWGHSLELISYSIS